MATPFGFSILSIVSRTLRRAERSKVNALPLRHPPQQTTERLIDLDLTQNSFSLRKTKGLG